MRLRWSAIPAALSLTGLTALALGVPVWTIVRWLRIGGSEVWQSPRIWSALSQTLTFGIAGALVATALAFPVAWLAVRWPGVISKIVEGTNYVTSSLPGIVTALALITVTIRYANPLYQTTTMVIVAYVLMFLPRSLVSLRSGLAQVPVGLEEASAALGKPPAATFWRVTLRLTAPSAAVGAALVFMAVATELTATLLLAPTGTSTLSTRFWALTGDLDYAAAAPYALLMIVLSLPMTYLFVQPIPEGGRRMSEIVIDKVSKSFGPTDVLRGVGIEVERGSITAVVGSSGCGKTTLLRIIAGFERPDGGTVSIGGTVVAGDGQMVPAHRRRVGYVAQDGALFRT